MAKRTTKSTSTDITPAAYQEALTNYAMADATATRKVAQMNMELARIREKFEQDITLLNEQKNGAFDVVNRYPAEIYLGAGFGKNRTNTPAVCACEKGSGQRAPAVEPGRRKRASASVQHRGVCGSGRDFFH